MRLIDADGAQLGIKSLPDALVIARDADLDLVEVAPMANPPVCRIMDYSRFKYETEQKAKESRRKTTNISVKEMKYRPKIGPGDFETKTRQVAKFLGQGHKVKITIMFRGREMSHQELGLKILTRVAEEVGPIAKVEQSPKVDGRNMVMILGPDKRAKPAAPHADPGASHNGSVPAEAATPATPEAPGVTATPEATNATATPEAPEAASAAPADVPEIVETIETTEVPVPSQEA